jgi:hypothetical protein
MLNAIGGGLIGWGALLLASTLVFPVVSSSVVEYERTSRNTRLATELSIASTAVGAVLLLVNSAWLYAFAGLGGGVAVWYVIQVATTWRAWRSLAAQVERERSLSGGRVAGDTAARAGVVPGLVTVRALRAHLMPSDGPAAPDAAAVVAGRSRLRWALLHPRGGRPPIPFGD